MSASNIGHHAPGTSRTPFTLRQRMAAYDRLPKPVRDAYKDAPCKMECVQIAYRMHEFDVGSVAAWVMETSRKAYVACYLDVFGEVPGSTQ